MVHFGNRIGIGTLIFLFLTAPAFAAPTVINRSDFTTTKLAVDLQIDPSIDETWVRSQIDHLAKATSDMLSPTAEDPEKLRAVRKAIYVAGPWNDNRPFAYDLSDPLGRKPVIRLLATYLKTRLGNCVSMPTLFLILADRLGVQVALSRAPDHLFVRSFGPNGEHINIETTSGGYPARDAYYREGSYITDTAIKNGVYLSDMTHEQTAEVMKGSLLNFLITQKRYPEAVALADEMMRIDPRNALALVARGQIYGAMIHDEFETKYKSPSLIPPALRDRYLFLARTSDASIEAAHALGWLDESEWPDSEKQRIAALTTSTGSADAKSGASAHP